MSNNKPAITFYDGSLRATAWKNTSDKGTFYRVTLSRRYRDEAGTWHDSDSFSGSELLRIARLAEQAYDYTLNLRRQDRENDSAE